MIDGEAERQPAAERVAHEDELFIRTGGVQGGDELLVDVLKVHGVRGGSLTVRGEVGHDHAVGRREGARDGGPRAGLIAEAVHEDDGGALPRSEPHVAIARVALTQRLEPVPPGVDHVLNAASRHRDDRRERKNDWTHRTSSAQSARHAAYCASQVAAPHVDAP